MSKATFKANRYVSNTLKEAKIEQIKQNSGRAVGKGNPSQQFFVL